MRMISKINQNLNNIIIAKNAIMFETLQNLAVRDETKHKYAVHEMQRRQVKNTSYPYNLGTMY